MTLRFRGGFTFVEVLVTILVMAILSSAMAVYLPAYFEKKRDDERKVDLKKLKIAFEDYAGDKQLYPSVAELNTCGSDALRPYLLQVPCDPLTRQPYRYVPAADRLSYQLYTVLEYETDPIIAGIGCASGCGPGGAYNYGVSGGGALVE